jgi:hypothetical protein
MRSVRKQRERICEQTAHNFQSNKTDVQRNADRERAAEPRRVRVMMSVVMGVRMRVHQRVPSPSLYYFIKPALEFGAGAARTRLQAW